MNTYEKTIKPIAFIRTGFGDKFGIPRQAGLAPLIKGRIIFEPEYRDASALRGLEGYSHIWIIFGFDRNREESSQGFNPTVRPPKLGGNERVGVFATRSPYRPNALGLSSVRLLEINAKGDNGPELIVTGVDMADMTPVYDIKPYIAFTDSHEDATGGFTSQTYGRKLEVRITENVDISQFDADFLEEVKSLVANDPRPGYQADPERIYHIIYGGYELDFKVNAEQAEIIHIAYY